MADINHTISLGIGSPAGIPEFLTFGLQLGNLWQEVDDSATTNWSAVDDSQSSAWSPVDDSVTTNWTNV